VIYGVLKFTRAGLIARGAMQNAQVVSAMGYSPSRIYMITFAAGAAVSGLAGGVLAPLTGLLPTSGGQFIAKSFITVIAGGSSVIAGTTAGSILFGGVAKITEMLSTTVVGEIALLVVAVVLLRILPTGITGRFFKGSV
jgi:urea transport system permease protein